MRFPHSHLLRIGPGLLLGVGLLPQPVRGHAGSLRAVSEAGPVPIWLVLLTGGGVIAVSFLLASFVTDRTDIEAAHALYGRIRVTATDWTRITRTVGVGILLAVIATGLFGPQTATANLAILIVWVGWWAGYPMTVYLVGNSWPAFNPWRTVASVLPTGNRNYPDGLGAWPAVTGLLGLVWLEVITPVAEVPWLLAATVLIYTIVTLAGAIVYSPTVWFGVVDPISRVFHAYGRIAPLQRTSDGIELRLPGAGLAHSTADGLDEIALILALLWVTTYDGLIATPLWTAAITPIVTTGVPPILVYLVAILLGFGLFLGIYRLASHLSRKTANSYVSLATIEAHFAPTLLPIAAGYHFAHFIDYFLTLAPTIITVLLNPLGTHANLTIFELPDWFGVIGLIAVLLGHLLAIWVAHATSFDLFPGRLQPLRSQYPFIIVMIFYTMTSMWIVTQPYTAPPFL